MFRASLVFMLAMGASTMFGVSQAHSHEAPTIDMAHWRTGDATLRDLVGKQVATAARDFGFFYVRGHGVSAHVIARADQAMHDFFALPTSEKQQIAADKTRALKTGRGYVEPRAEQLDVTDAGRPDLKEVLDLGLPLGNATHTYLGPNPWPASMPSLQADTEPYLKAVSRLGMELLPIVARSIRVPEDSFADIFDEPLVVQRLMRYPGNVSTADSEELGCGAHYDFGGLTLLRQSDSAGLQVQPPALHASHEDDTVIDGAVYGTMKGTFYSDLQNRHVAEWVPVAAQPDLFVVTFGEAMQRLTNGEVQATRHRVVHQSDTARHSMAVFVDPNPHKEVVPLRQLGEAKYSGRIAGHKTVLLAATLALQKASSSVGGGQYLGFGRV